MHLRMLQTREPGQYPLLHFPASKKQSISNIIRWNAGLLGRSSRRLMVESLFDRLGIKQWVDGLAFAPFKGLINS